MFENYLKTAIRNLLKNKSSSFINITGLARFGIRKALGTSEPGVVLLLSKEFSKWVILANIIAWPIAYFTMKKLAAEFC